MAAKDKNLKLGFITTVSGRWLLDLPKERHATYSKWLQDTFPNVSLVSSDGIAVSNDDVGSAAEKFRVKDVDAVVVLIGAFTSDIVCTMIAEKLNVPIILWALPEPQFDGGRIMSNALVAATMNQGALKRLGLKSHFIYGGIDDGRCVKEISSYIRIYSAYKKLKNTYLGLIGYRPTGFYSSQFDETLIRKTFGITMEEFDVIHLINTANKIAEEDVEKDMKDFASSVPCAELPDEYLQNHSKLYLGLKKIIEDNKFDGLSLKCWPELGFMKCTPCAIVSRLADEGVIIGCEADVDATISMLILNYLTGKMVFMSDLISIDEKDNTALFWHCGQAGRELHGDKRNTCACDHSLAGQGVVIEGTLKTGRVTICRMSQIGDEYKLFLTKGEVIPTEKVVKGVMASIKMDKPVRDMIYTIAEEGIPHHYSIVWEDVYDDIKLFAKNMGIEIIEA